MSFHVRPLALGIRQALAAVGGATLLLALAPAALADNAPVTPGTGSVTPATPVSTTPAAAAPAASNTVVAGAGDNSAAPADNTPTPAANQAAPETPSRQLGAVVVTAQRRAEKIQDVPSTVTAVSGTQIQDTDAGSSAANVTNFVANTSAGETSPTRPRWWIRGVGTGAQGFDAQSPVGVYFDDVYFSNANATGQPVYDLQRVEVLEGPQGTLWGKNTTGGAIDFVSVKPSFNDSGYVKLDQSSHDDQLFEAAYGGTIIPDVLAGRASFHAESAAGAYNDSDSGTPEVQFHDDAGRVQFLANLAPDVTALLNVHFRDYYGNGNDWSAIGAGPNGAYYKATSLTPAYTPNPAPDVVDANAPNTTQVRQDGLALTLNAPVGRNQLTSISAFEGFQTVAFSDSDDTPLELGRGYNAGDTHQLSEELRVASPRSDRINWVGGGMFFTEDINSNTVAAILPDVATGSTPTSVAPKFLDTFFQQNTKSYALFGSSTVNFTDQFNVTGGLRYTDEKKSDNLNIIGSSAAAGSSSSAAPYNNVSTWWLPSSVNNLTTQGTQDDSKNWGAWTYDLTPEYKITDHARAYFRYAHGFRAGGYNSSATTQANTNVVNPETLTSYELGAKTEWLDGQLIANGDFFYYDYDDIQVNAVSSGISYLTNAGRGKASGAELTLEALPVENLHLRWNAGWLNTRFLDYTTSGISYAGDHFVRSPHLSDVFSADYRLPLSNGHDLLFGTDWKYQSKYFFYNNDQVDGNVTQAGYTLGDARLSYIIGKITLTAYVQNLTDKIYKEHTLLQTNSTAPSPSNIYLGGDTVSWSEGRIVGASITAHF